MKNARGLLRWEGKKMKQLYKFLLIFCFLSIVGLLGNLINKHNLNILTAISVAFRLLLALFLSVKNPKKNDLSFY